MAGPDDGDPKVHSYADYLRLDTLLSCQEQQSDSGNELLFITIHQSKELWFKLMIHELQQAIAALFEGRALPAHKMLNRVSRIESTLVHTWDILQTLSPDEYLSFRPIVGREGASGFQSYQYRFLAHSLSSPQTGWLAIVFDFPDQRCHHLKGGARRVGPGRDLQKILPALFFDFFAQLRIRLQRADEALTIFNRHVFSRTV